MSSEKFVMEAKTFEGLEDVLKDELIGIGASDVEVISKGVKFTGSLEMLYKANFCCRTALRILVIIKEFDVKSTNDLYTGVRNIDWMSYFDIQRSFSVVSTVHAEAFNNSMFVSLKTKDAIVDQFKAKLGKRPSVNAENPDIRIHVHASTENVTVALDSSGESLTKRGYRPNQTEGTMSEVLAAGILKIAGWNGQSDFYDPICGLGIMPIEAALIARNIPPGIFRKSFAFEKWKNFDADIFDTVYNADYEIPFEHTIYASDVSVGNVRISTENARNAGLKKDIQFSTADFATLKPQKDTGLIIVNPPAAQRGNERMVDSMFKMIGDSLKHNFKGIKAWVFSNSEEGFRSIGLKASTIIKLYNGTIESELRNFEMYDGSKSFPKPEFRPRNSNDRFSRDSRDSSNFRGSGRTDSPGARRERSFGTRDNDSRPTQTGRNDRSFGSRDANSRPTQTRRDDKSFGSRDADSRSTPTRRDDRSFGTRDADSRPSQNRRDESKGTPGGNFQNRRRSDSPARNNDGPKRPFRKPER
jgi:putative N6-adenine-specific DNA methylase